MKNFILFVMTALLMSCLTLTTSCSGNKPTSKEKVVRTIPEKVYADCDELLAAQVKIIDAYERESVFRSIPPNCFKNICTVLNHKSTPITIKNVVEEYTSHKDVYLSLQPPSENDIYDSLQQSSTDTENTTKDGIQSSSSSL